MGFNRAIGYMGVNVQSARGTAASAAAFKFPIYSGGIKPVVNLSDDEISAASRNQADPYIAGSEVTVEFETRAFVGSFVMLMEAVMGSRTTTGAGDPYSHTCDTGTLPYLTFFESIGPSDAVRISVQDVKIDTLDVTWDGPGACRVSVSGKGSVADMTAADFDGTAIDETDGDGYFYPLGGTFQWDAVGTSAADMITPSGGIRFANGLAVVRHAGQIVPYDHQEGKLAAGFDLNIVVDDLEDWIEVLTAATNGSALATDVQYGKANIVLAEAGTGTHTATFTASRVPWQITPVEIDAGANVTELSVTGQARYNSTESDAIGITITNANAGTVYGD